MHTHSYWEAETLEHRYDLAVVGAGLVGLSAALHYKRQHSHARVVVLEQTLGPNNASTRNAGFACFGSPTELLADIATMGEDACKALIAARWQGLQLLRDEIGDIPMYYEPCGGNEIFLPTDEASHQQALAFLPKLNQWLYELTGQRDVYTPTTVNGYAAIHNRLEGALHTGHLMQALLHRVQVEMGIVVMQGVQVQGVAPGQLHLSGGTVLAAQQILLATNAHTSLLVPDIQITPARNYVFVTTPLRPQPWQGTFHYDRGYIYFRHMPGGRVLLGGARQLDYATEATLDTAYNPIIKDHLIGFANEVLHLPKGWQVAQEWTGHMGFAHDHHAVLRQVQPGLFVAAGMGGMGVALGMGFGEKAAELLLLHS